MAQQDKFVTLDDMYKAYEDCRKKKKNKAGTVKFEQYALFNCLKLVEEINARKYKLKPSECFIVEYPTPREVFCASFRDRVVQHFVYNELSPVIEKMLIADTCSCRLKKGTDYAIKREIRKLRQVTENYTKDARILERQGMAMNTRKSIVQKGEYGVPFLGVIVRPYYAVLGKQRINRIYKGGREFTDPYKAYESIATRKGMFQRYHGRHVARRWFDSLPQDVTKDIRMESDTSIIWLGSKPRNKQKLLMLEESL